MRLTPTSSTIILSKPNGPSELFTTFAMAIAAIATKVFGYVEKNIKKYHFEFEWIVQWFASHQELKEFRQH
jgi:hypothetical protein